MKYNKISQEMRSANSFLEISSIVIIKFGISINLANNFNSVICNALKGIYIEYVQHIKLSHYHKWYELTPGKSGTNNIW